MGEKGWLESTHASLVPTPNNAEMEHLAKDTGKNAITEPCLREAG